MIVVFGSINMDLVMRVARLPRPGETVLAPGYRAVAGGKGANQALAAARAGAEVALYGCVGRDAFAADSLTLLRRAGVDLGGVAECDAATGCAVVCVDEAGENQIVVASGANTMAVAGQVPDSALGPDTTLVLQLEIDQREIGRIIERGRDRGARIVLNAAPASARPQPAAALSAVDVLVVNEIEAAMLADGIGSGPAAGPDAAAAIAERYAITTIVTLGAAGAAGFAPDAAWAVEALPVSAVDTTAAGDAFTGCLAAALDGGAALDEAMRRASVAAGLACTEAGAQTSLPTADQIAARLNDLPAPVRIKGVRL